MFLKKETRLLKFFTRKIIFYFATFLIALSLVWLIPRLMPGDPVGLLVAKIVGGATGGGSSPLYKLLYHNWIIKFGLDKPLHEQYVLFLKNMVTFSFGPSIFYYPVPAFDIVLQAIPWSLGLLVPAIVLGWVVGTYLGAAAAFKKGIYDRIFYPLFLVGANTPYYWFALIMVSLLSGSLRLFPPGGAYSVLVVPGFTIEFISDFLYHYALPFTSLLIPYIGRTALGMRATVLYEIGSDYMEYSESLGFSSGKLLKYAFRNAVLPSLTVLPMLFGGAFAGQVVSELVFGYPGIGLLLYNSLINQDYNIVQCAFTLVVFVVLLGNFLMDIVYAYVDPRIRIAYEEE